MDCDEVFIWTVHHRAAGGTHDTVVDVEEAIAANVYPPCFGLQPDRLTGAIPRCVEEAVLHCESAEPLRMYVSASKRVEAAPRNANISGVVRYTQKLWIGVEVRSAAYPPGC